MIQSVSQLMNDKSVIRMAPATPGLLNIFTPNLEELMIKPGAGPVQVPS